MLSVLRSSLKVAGKSTVWLNKPDLTTLQQSMRLLTDKVSYRFLDINQFRTATGGFEEIRQETSKAFVEFMPLIVKEIKDAVKQSSESKTAKALHKLKASAALACIQSLNQEIKALEKDVAQVAERQYVARIDKLVLAINVLIAEVKVYEALLKWKQRRDDNNVLNENLK